VVQLQAFGSDGSEVTSAALGARFPSGLFVAMSDDRTYHFYSWEAIAGNDLVLAPDGIPARRHAGSRRPQNVQGGIGSPTEKTSSK